MHPETITEMVMLVSVNLCPPSPYLHCIVATAPGPASPGHVLAKPRTCGKLTLGGIESNGFQIRA